MNDMDELWEYLGDAMESYSYMVLDNPESYGFNNEEEAEQKVNKMWKMYDKAVMLSKEELTNMKRGQKVCQAVKEIL